MHNVKSIFQMNTMISVYRSSPAKYQFSENWFRYLINNFKKLHIACY